MCGNKVNGDENVVVSEMMKQLLLEKKFNYEVLPRTFHVSDGGSKFVEDCEIGVLTKSHVEPKKEIRSYRAIALTSVMSKWFAPFRILRLEQERGTRIGRNLHVGGFTMAQVCQHLQLLATNLQQKHWEWQEVRGSHIETRQRDTANDVSGKFGQKKKKAFDEARPRHVAQIMKKTRHTWMDYFSPLARDVGA